MLPELLPELINPILTLLSLKDIKNVSLCSKLCNNLVAPMMWENVEITSDHLLASTSVPSHIAFANNLRIYLYGITDKNKQEVMNKLVVLLKLSSSTTLTLTLFRRAESSIVTRCLATISELTGLKNLNISGCNISDAGLQHIGRLTDLIDLNIVECNISDRGLQHLCRQLVNLKIKYIKNAKTYYF